MNLLTTKKAVKCKKCSGFGVFERVNNETKLVECPACFSIHPEVFGLTYRESEDVMAERNYRFYVQKPETIIMYLTLGILLLIGFVAGLSIGIGL